ncbi:MAG: hypothetical protein EPO39_04310 [Candidatus Manganitrophaceae bacterium]|nr:MAG: hypothetical protein EPO39_04310 [Candidatus Manganitrophaceae bacterium]
MNQGKELNCNRQKSRGISVSISRFYFWSVVIALLFTFDPAAAQDDTPLDTRVGLYYNYYFPRYTNTPLLIRRDCTCQLAYQTGVGIQKRLFLDAWLDLHTYVMGGTPGAGESHEQFGVRMEGQYRLERVAFLIGIHNEWNVDRPSNFPTTSRNGNDLGTDGLRETYIGITWWIVK